MRKSFGLNLPKNIQMNESQNQKKMLFKLKASLRIELLFLVNVSSKKLLLKEGREGLKGARR